jgi:hypothetical protein
MRPKLRTLIPDVYKDVSYVLDDDAYSAAEYHDVVRKRFIKSWDSLVDIYKVRCCRVFSAASHSGLDRKLLRTIIIDFSLDWLLT